MRKLLTDEIASVMAQDYLSGKFLIGEISKKYGFCRASVKKALNKYNVETKKGVNYRNRNFNEDYFSCVDTPLKAWFLGFLYADGNIYRTKTGNLELSLEIHQRDEDVLYKLREAVNGEGKITVRKRSEITIMSTYRICSQKIVGDLVNLGIVPNKTYVGTTQIFKNIPDEYMRDFVRGLIDGDGFVGTWIDKNTYNKERAYMGFVSHNRSITKMMLDYLNSVLPRPSGRSIYEDSHSKDICYRICFDNPEDLKILLPFLYDTGEYALPRKKESAIHAMKILGIK